MSEIKKSQEEIWKWCTFCNGFQCNCANHSAEATIPLWIPTQFLQRISGINSLSPGRFEWKVIVIFKLNSVIDGWGISCEIAIRWMSLDLTDDKSRLVQVMAWCRQATSHYLNQCWPRSISPYGVTRPQWVNNMCENLLELLIWNGFGHHFSW